MVYIKKSTHSWCSEKPTSVNKKIVCCKNIHIVPSLFFPTLALFFQLHFLYSIIVCNFPSFLPLCNRAADAEPGPHSKTAGVRVSQLINTQNYVPPPNHISFFFNMHREKQREKGFFFHYHFIKYTLIGL